MNPMKKLLALLLCLSLALCLVACRASTGNTEEPIDGGWSTGEPTAPDAEQLAVFEKATETLTGASYTPVLLLSTQVVAGYNYRFLCKAHGSYLESPETWAIVEIYEDPQGNATLTDVTDITDEEAAQYGVEIGAADIGGMQIANPFIDCESFEAAAEIAGFAITAPEGVEGYPNRMIQAVEADMIQVFYTTGDMAVSDTESVLLRKAVGSEDVSGDYNEYGEVSEQDVDGLTVTLKGDGERVYLAIWTDGDYSYSVSVSDGAGLDAILELVNGLK